MGKREDKNNSSGSDIPAGSVTANVSAAIRRMYQKLILRSQGRLGKWVIGLLTVRVTYQHVPNSHLCAQITRGIKSRESSFSSGRSRAIWALLVRSTRDGVYGTLAADTDTTTAEERQSVVMSNARIIFFSFDLVRCFLGEDGQEENKRRGIRELSTKSGLYTAGRALNHKARRTNSRVTKTGRMPP